MCISKPVKYGLNCLDYSSIHVGIYMRYFFRKTLDWFLWNVFSSDNGGNTYYALRYCMSLYEVYNDMKNSICIKKDLMIGAKIIYYIT